MFLDRPESSLDLTTPKQRMSSGPESSTHLALPRQVPSTVTRDAQTGPSQKSQLHTGRQDRVFPSPVSSQSSVLNQNSVDDENGGSDSEQPLLSPSTESIPSSHSEGCHEKVMQ